MTGEKKVLGFEIKPTSWIVYSSFHPEANIWSGLVSMQPQNQSLWPSPMSAGLNYAHTVFEGMKAFRHQSGEIFLFRPRNHAERFGRSLKGLAMPYFPESKFLMAVQSVVVGNAEFVPNYREGSLYIRPIAWPGDKLGYGHYQKLPHTAAFYCSPVGNYYTEGLKPISVYVAREMTRAMPGGVGSYKCAGNYVISSMAKLLAEQNGCQDALFLDGKTQSHIEELGGANIFAIKNNVLYTPILRDTILPGITRRSIMTLAKAELRMKVCERDISVEQLAAADEVFASGTAAVITPIGSVKNGKTIYTINNGEVGQITIKLYDLLTGIQYGDVPDKFGWLMKAIF